MNCHNTSWPVACPRYRDTDGAPLVPCELQAHVDDARCVAITGTMLRQAERLVMTQQPRQNWMARLLLTPGRYTVRVHVVKAALNLPEQCYSPDSWEVTFNVPELQGDMRHTVELRLWLHDPTIANAIWCNRHGA